MALLRRASDVDTRGLGSKPQTEPHGEWERLRGMEIRHLAVLAAVASERSFKSAARRLGYAQSAVSQLVAELERIVGIRLVERAPGRPTRLTDAGALLVEHAETILSRVSAARADMEAVTHDAPLRVGLSEIAGARVLSAILPLLDDAARAAMTTSEREDEQRLLDELEQGELDLAFSELPLPEERFAFVELLEDPCVLLVPAKSPLAERPNPPALHEIATLPLVARAGSRLQQRVDAHLLLQGRGRPCVQRAGSDAAVCALVSGGVGAAILPRLSVDTADSGTVAIQLDGVFAPRVLVLAWQAKRGLAPAGRRFRAAALEASARLRREQAGVDGLLG